MKLESSLDLRPGLLHIVPVVNVAILFVMVLLYANGSVQQSGIRINLPVSAATLPPLAESRIVFVSGDRDAPRIALDQQAIELDDLCAQLARPSAPRQSIVLRADHQIPYGIVMRIADAALTGQHDLIYATRPGETTAAAP